MKNPWYILLALFTWLNSFDSIAQVFCGYDMGRADTTKAKYFKAEEEKMNWAIRSQILKTRASNFTNGVIRNQSTGVKSTSTPPLPATVYIPVVFHIIDENPFATTDAMVQAALDDLNKAFAHQGAYGVDTLGADTRIQFKLNTCICS